MTTTTAKLQQLPFYCVAPVACSVVIGLIVAHGRVFHLHSTAFQFVANSIIAAVFYYLLVLSSRRNAYFGLVLLFVLAVLTTRSTRPALILRDLLAVGGIGLSMLLYHRYFRDLVDLKFFYPPILLAGIYGVVNLITSELNFQMVRMFSPAPLSASFMSVAGQSVFLGVLIGFAVGCGIALNERFAPVATSA